MGDRCIKHRKAYVGVCNWCGVHVCELCIADRNGNKVYCDKCVGKLSPFKGAKMPPPPQPRQQGGVGIRDASGKNLPPAKDPVQGKRLEPYY